MPWSVIVCRFLKLLHGRLGAGVGDVVPLDDYAKLFLRLQWEEAEDVPAVQEDGNLVVGEAGFDVEIGEGERFLKGPSREGDAEQMAHRTVRPVAADQPAHPQPLRGGAGRPAQHRLNAGGVLREAGQLDAALRADAEAGQTLRQEAFRFRLRQDESVLEAARDPVEAHVNDPFRR